MKNLKNLVGVAIKNRRTELNLTQEQLAEKSELHRTYIGDIERGKRNISLDNLLKITSSLELKLSDFFSDYVERE